MHETRSNDIVHSISRHIRKSTKPVTILLTDIEGSTKYFDKHGDIDGRLMVDQHNRMVFPVITRYRGKVIKTTGDGVMASFRTPHNAVKAAIGIQQLLEKQREKDKAACPYVRIGIHTGEAIVERKDVFGDAVNVAVRVGSRGKGDEILVSGKTVAALNKSEFNLVKKGSFTPKGKARPLAVYRCHWKDHSNLIGDIRLGSFLPLIKQQKAEIFVYSLASISVLYFLYLKYLRYAVADHEYVALLILNPRLILNVHPVIPAALVLIAAAAAVMLYRIKTVPYLILRLMKGGFGFSLGFLAIYLPLSYVPFNPAQWNEKLFESHHLFVEVLEDKTDVRQAPSLQSKPLRTVNATDLLLLADVTARGGLSWNKVLVGKNKYGWVPRVLPPKIGQPEKRLTLTYKFSFRYYDLYALLAGFAGFVWGFLNFRIRPT